MGRDPYTVHTRWQPLTRLGWWVIGLLVVSGAVVVDRARRDDHGAGRG